MTTSTPPLAEAAAALIECMVTRLYPAAGELTENVITSLLHACSDELKIEFSRRLTGRLRATTLPTEPAYWATALADGLACTHGVTGCSDADLDVLTHAAAAHMQHAMQQWLTYVSTSF